MTSDISDNGSLKDLKDLLLTPEHEKIHTLENRLDDPMIRAEEISTTLPDAISLSVRRSDQLSRVIQPVIDQSIKSSVQNNSKAFADAIFPALGPGIRKAITATIMGMIQSLNQVLNHSFSFKGLKWRFEAFRTGKPFAEVVLLNTLVYQVEQIFLIHKKTGLVLEHVVDKNTVIQDPDLVSGMLTAIQDFVNDSFANGPEEELETLRIGSDRTVWIVMGGYALIATVLRGTPPLDLRIQYQTLLEEIHIKSGAALRQFNGDPSSFAVFRESLKDGLKSKVKTDKKKISPLLMIFLSVIVGLLIYSGYQKFQIYKFTNSYLNRLLSQKGILVLSTTQKKNRLHISGLKDAFATDPKALLTDKEKQVIQLSTNWQPYYCLDPEFILHRARSVLKPAETVELELADHILIAKGQASHEWILQFKQISPTLPGIDGYNTASLINKDKIDLQNLIKQLSEIKIYFINNRPELVKGQEEQLTHLLNTMVKLQTLQNQMNASVQVAILGHADSSGSERLNLRLSRNRAEKVFNYLMLNGVNPSFITLSGIGTQLPLSSENTMEDRRFNRAVSFKIFYSDAIKGDKS